ncbi:leucyl aminopeptidase family protein [Fulvimarina endophytica]|uniref:Leucyl aminopeptidase family protein n=1 Tax=Fulvimarina endophytica TaxID=2293836 RepID=A0A371X7E4_9HYPH|nr:leucyl aminopeptidase family protein [Fulvimarina endophytica]RFC65150.1 leucyl aminopeptidase family protein [Fulvimarina endophytica]
MSVTLTADRSASSRPILPVRPATRDSLPDEARRWAEISRFEAKAGSVCLVPGDGGLACVLLGLGKAEERDPSDGARAALLAGALARALPEGAFHLDGTCGLDMDLTGLALRLGAYRFDRYKSGASGDASGPNIEIHLGEGRDLDKITAVADGVALARDLINTPVNDMGPGELETAIRDLAARHGAEVSAITGEDLLEHNFPMIHAVGRASASAPRLVEMVWGRKDAPKVTLVGKGVCFDTGGLDIKPPSSMLLMKKDMGGAANVLGLAAMIMATKLDLRLRVLVPAVENSISANAFRPSDILTSRKGRTVEVGNTDAEGRLVLADALSYGDEEEPELMIDMATLTGAARVALGPDLPAFFTGSDPFAGEVAEAGTRLADPSWRLPLYRPYAGDLSSKVADTNNVSSGGFAGAITAALFLEGFVEKATTWAHFDIYGWRPSASAIGPVGGEAYAIRSLFDILSTRYPAR